MSEKLYVCMDDANKLSIQPKEDVEAWIKEAEKGEDDPPYTVLGSIAASSTFKDLDDKEKQIIFYLIQWTMPGAVGYSITGALSEEGAKEAFFLKKFNKGKSIRKIQDLSNLIKEYYE